MGGHRFSDTPVSLGKASAPPHPKTIIRGDEARWLAWQMIVIEQTWPGKGTRYSFVFFFASRDRGSCFLSVLCRLFGGPFRVVSGKGSRCTYSGVQIKIVQKQTKSRSRTWQFCSLGRGSVVCRAGFPVHFWHVAS